MRELVSGKYTSVLSLRIIGHISPAALQHITAPAFMHSLQTDLT